MWSMEQRVQTKKNWQRPIARFSRRSSFCRHSAPGVPLLGGSAKLVIFHRSWTGGAFVKTVPPLLRCYPNIRCHPDPVNQLHVWKRLLIDPKNARFHLGLGAQQVQPMMAVQLRKTQHGKAKPVGATPHLSHLLQLQ